MNKSLQYYTKLCTRNTYINGYARKSRDTHISYVIHLYQAPTGGEMCVLRIKLLQLIIESM